jgi:cyclin A
MRAQTAEETAEERFNRVLLVPEYCEEIYTYLREAETRNRAKASYMRKQPDITASMRSILVDWLVEVAEEYKLHRETLYLSVNYIDRFLSQMSVLRGKLQLVGAASMFIASKYEEIYPPEVGEFVYITDDTYTKKQVLRMEHLILKVLSFDVAVPTINCLCEKFLKDMDADDKTSSLAYYLSELTLVDGDTYLKYAPSLIAASAVCLANHTLGQEAWPMKMAESTKYSVQDFEDCLKDMYTTFQNAPSHPQQAIREKYKDRKYQQVSLLTPPPLSAH